MQYEHAIQFIKVFLDKGNTKSAAQFIKDIRNISKVEDRIEIREKLIKELSNKG